MNTAIVKRQSAARIALIDATMVCVACLVPILSHLTALPLYRLNPMTLVLLIGMAAVRDPESGMFSRLNALLMAVLMPVVSMLTVGMPTPTKAICMVAELMTIASVASLLEGTWHRHHAANQSAMARFANLSGLTLVAMLCGKVVYYGLKALLIPAATLVGTPLLTQAAVTVAAAGLYALLLNRKR